MRSFCFSITSDLKEILLDIGGQEPLIHTNDDGTKTVIGVACCVDDISLHEALLLRTRFLNQNPNIFNGVRDYSLFGQPLDLGFRGFESKAYYSSIFEWMPFIKRSHAVLEIKLDADKRKFWSVLINDIQKSKKTDEKTLSSVQTQASRIYLYIPDSTEVLIDKDAWIEFTGIGQSSKLTIQDPFTLESLRVGLAGGGSMEVRGVLKTETLEVHSGTLLGSGRIAMKASNYNHIIEKEGRTAHQTFANIGGILDLARNRDVLHLDGNYRQLSKATMKAHISDKRSSKLEINGNAELSGSLVLEIGFIEPEFKPYSLFSSLDKHFKGSMLNMATMSQGVAVLLPSAHFALKLPEPAHQTKIWTLIEANSINGKFDSFVSNAPNGFRFELIYTPTSVEVHMLKK